MDAAAHITTEEHDGALRVRIAGEVDMATELEAIELQEHHKRVVVDTTAVTFAGSLFLSWLLVLKQRAELVLDSPSESVLRLIDVAGLRDEFTVEPEVAQREGADDR